MMAEKKTQVDNVFQSYNGIESMITALMAGMTEQMFAKDISTLVADFLDDILE